MNVMLLVAGLLSVLIGIAHSVLGEKLVLGPLFDRGEVSEAARQHRLCPPDAEVYLAPDDGAPAGDRCGSDGIFRCHPPTRDQPASLQVLAATFTVCSLLSLIGARAKHFSWWVFLIIAVLLWFGA